VLVAGADKFKAAPVPRLRFTWDEKPLTQKEADELLPRVRGWLDFIFRQMDKFISATNRDRAEAEIWQEIDAEDIDIIANHLVDMAKASRIVATAVRRISNSFRMLQIGLITAPKFIQTAQFYSQHGGFTLFPPVA
jgi:hypothetical protein